MENIEALWRKRDIFFYVFHQKLLQEIAAGNESPCSSAAW
jgi:hypothetical protein